MRVILKPGGLVFLLLAITALAIIAFGKIRSAANAAPRGTEGAASAPAPAAPTVGDSAGANAVLPTSHRQPGQLIDPTSQSWSLAVQSPARAKMDLFLADDLPAANDKHALHLDILSVDPNKYWAAQLIKSVPDPVAIGHNVVVHFWARSKTNNTAHIVFEEGKDPHTPQLSQVVTFTPAWKQYNFPFVTTKDNTVVHANFCVKASVTPGEIDIAQLYVEDKGAG